MSDFEQKYQGILLSLGMRASIEYQTPEEEIICAERRLGVHVPLALRSFYRVAGRATEFTCRYDRFVEPSEWVVENGKIVFLEESQSTVLYATDLSVGDCVDAPVFMASNDGLWEWYLVCQSCSEFIQAMLCWEGAFGGSLAERGSAMVPQDFQSQLDDNWSFVGEVNDMRAYARQGRAVCFVQWNDGWCIFVGATSRELLVAVEDELSVTLVTD